MTKELEITLAELLLRELEVTTSRKMHWENHGKWVEDTNGKSKINASMPCGISRPLINNPDAKVLAYKTVEGLQVIGIIKTKKKHMGFACEKTEGNPTKIYPMPINVALSLINRTEQIKTYKPKENMIMLRALAVLETVC